MSLNNPRGVNRIDQGASSTPKARLPSIPPVRTADLALNLFCAAVKEHLEVREGARGNPFEQVLTRRDIDQLGMSKTQILLDAGGSVTGIQGLLSDGTVASLTVAAIARTITSSTLFTDLTKRLDDQSRFDELPAQIRQQLLVDIADEAARRGAEIRRVETRMQTATNSFASAVEEVTASVAASSAGVRQSLFASADLNRATAGTVTQVQARLDNFNDGTPGLATVEQKMTATADRSTGLEAQYTLKVQAGGKVAGFGLAATSSVAGAATSAFIVQADKFAIVSASDNITDPANPDLSRVPFGVDASGIYINGQVRINANGPTISEVGRRIVLSASSAVFKVNATGTPDPTSITLTAALENGLAGTPTFTVISGSATLTGAGLTRALAYSAMATNRVTIRASVTADGVTYNSDFGLYKAFDGSAGTTGANGSAGSAGTRGSVTRYGSGSFSDAGANALLPSLPQVIGDTVTFSTSTTAVTRYWSGTAWVDPGVVIDGNLLVTGTVSAAKISAGTINAAVSLQTTGYIKAEGSFTSGAGEYAITANQSGNSTSGLYAQSRNNVNFAYGIYGMSNAGTGILGATNNGAGVAGIATASGVGVSARSATGFALAVDGRMSITNSTMVANLNAQYVNGLTSDRLAQLVATNSGTATVSGSGFNLIGDATSDIASAFVIVSGTGNIARIRVTNVSPSDSRLKKDVEDVALGLDFVNQLRPVSYRLKGDASGRQGFGFIAQEVEQLIPTGSTLVYFDPEREVGDIKGHRVINYQSYIAVLVKAVQELTARVAQLESRT